MSTPTGHGQLCSLLEQRLRPLLKDCGARASSAEATEKCILIALSQVFRQVKQWTSEFDSHEGLLQELVNQRQHSGAVCSCSDYRHCFSMIIDDLVFLVSCDSQYIQHLAGNTLIAIAEFLDASENGLEDFVDLMCVFLERAISICISSSPVSTNLNTQASDIDPVISRSSSKLKNGNWLVVASIFRVLRNILKHLKREYDEKILTPYLDSFSSLILRIPWDAMSKIFDGPDVGAIKKYAEDESLHGKVVQQRERSMLFANMIQYLSSLIELSNCVEEGLRSRPFIREIINLMPKIIVWCHAMPEHHVRISCYFRHKVLMLMMKLSDCISTDSNVLMSWIHLLHQYFEGLLLQPLTHKGKVDKDDIRVESPFCTSVLDSGMSSISARHLQRLTVSIFLKCSINLGTMKGNSDDQHSAPVDLNMNFQCGYKNKGFMELNKWLVAHVHADLANDDFYLQGCLRFTSSFLNLFMHEDDLLFDALLQLLCLPFHVNHRNTEDKPVAEAEHYHNFLTSDLLSPLHLFHLFLAELMYDHQVLLDYLISKDTGSSCAEYLLRSLRIVCNFWELFVEFPGAQETSDESSSKRRKYVLEHADFKALPSSAQANDGTTSSHGNKCDKVCEPRLKSSRNHRQPFLSAKNCLMSLKNSIESLHQKNLFPYNPKALLQRGKKLPPGPKPLPLIGSLHLLGKQPHKSLTKLARIHGPIMLVRLGFVNTLVISSAEMAREVLQKQDMAFSARNIPDALCAHDHYKFSVVWLPVASKWKSLRKILNSNIFSTSMLDASHHLRVKKIEELLACCERSSQTGEAVNVGRVAFQTSLNLLSNTIFSRDLTDPFFDSAKDMKELVGNIMVEAGKPNLVDFFPFLQKIDPLSIRRRMTVHVGKMIELLHGLINERLENKQLKDSFRCDVLDQLLSTSKESPESIDRAHIERLFVDLFAAGTDTTSSTVEWAMTETLRNPVITKKAKHELEKVIGKGKIVDESEIPRLPYLRCIVKETLRLHPPVPFLIPRRALEDVEVCGYTVPKNSQVFVNCWAIGRDPQTWKNPLEFRPERFLESDVDVRGQDFELIPFGAGRRICPGLPLAVRTVHVMLGSLLNSFDWKLDCCGGELDMEEKFGITLQKADPLKAVPFTVNVG